MENEQLIYGNLFWFEYRQNNSGGSFAVNNDVSNYVYIQAESTEAANAKAEEVGIYFDGCEKGWDCDCCGDRWYPSHGPMDELKVYDWKEPPQEYDNICDFAQAAADKDMWAAKGLPSVIVYFADGLVKHFHKTGESHE